MNKSIKRLLSVLLAVLVLTALSATALADDIPNTDEYTVTLSMGNIIKAVEDEDNVHPYITGETSWTVQAGKSVEFGSVEGLDNSRYYFKGFRPAGEDNNVIYPDGIENVTEDADYVAAYGLRGELVAYTVNYQGPNGAMADSMVHYGNVGDKMIVGAREFDGYQPQAYQLAKTLVENEAENVFTFRYSEIIVPTPEPAVQPTPYVYTEGAETPAEGEEAAPAEGAAEEVEPAPEPEEPVEPAPEPETEEITEEDTPLNNAPQELIDLDEEDTPLGSAPVEREKTELQQEREQSEKNFYVAAGLLGVALIAIAVLVVLLVRRRGAKS